MIIKIFFIITLITCTPTILFHGLGDSCSWSSLKPFFEKMKAECIEIGNGPSSSVIWGFQEQAEDACKKVVQKYGGQKINIIGLSQGALIGRYIITDCNLNGGKVSKYLSIGGPQMGVSVIPHCNNYLCWPLNKVVDSLVYTNYVQSHIGPAGYFRNHEDLESYLKYCQFLPDLNNERNPNKERKQRFIQLDAMMLVMFTKDQMILPKESAFFQSVDPITSEILAYNETEFYKNDMIGFKTLNEQNKVKFVEINSTHLNWQHQDIINYDEIFVEFLFN